MSDENHEPPNTTGLADLLPGRSYRVEVDDDGVPQLRLLAQSDANLPRVPILPAVLTEMRGLQRSMRSKQLGGWRPDIALVVSALVTHGLANEDAKRIVRDYVKHHMEMLDNEDV